MKKITLFTAGVLLILSVIIQMPVIAAGAPEISASTAAVMDLETGQVLYDKHMHVKRPPASTTKILTAIIAIERCDPEEIVTVSRRAAEQEGSSIWLEPGEELSMEDLIYAILLASGNDAAVAVAEHISGSIEKFAELMNRKARNIGARNSNFLNPHGLPEDGHYSTAYDLAKIMCYALKNETFSRMTSTKYRTIPWAGNEWDRGLRNHNKLLWSYEGITGGKTGYTKAAGRCLVSSARRDGREVVTVVMNCPQDWLDSRKLLNYGLDNFRHEQVVGAGEKVYRLPVENATEPEFFLLAEDPVYACVPRGGKITVNKEITLKKDIILPVKKKETLGKLAVYYRDQEIGNTELVADRDLHYNSLFKRYWYRLTRRLNSSFLE